METSKLKEKSLLDLPAELIVQIACKLLPDDFGNLLKTCKYLKNLLPRISEPSNYHYFLWKRSLDERHFLLIKRAASLKEVETKIIRLFAKRLSNRIRANIKKNNDHPKKLNYFKKKFFALFQQTPVKKANHFEEKFLALFRQEPFKKYNFAERFHDEFPQLDVKFVELREENTLILEKMNSEVALQNSFVDKLFLELEKS